jgi:Flp pilus assembly protein TadD
MRSGLNASFIPSKFGREDANYLFSRGIPLLPFCCTLTLIFCFATLRPTSVDAQTVYSQEASSTRSPATNFVGNEPCVKCHADIAKTYEATAMARASGPAIEGLLTGDFVHAPSGVHYRVYQEDGRAWMSFERSGNDAVRGKRQLLYYIGSGHRGRTYLFSVDDFVFEAPMNWYGQQRLWDMAPAYQKATQIPMNLPAVSSCLACHTSNSQLPVAGTENKYELPLFAHGGITCERCHGPGQKHVAQATAGNIVNPSKLSPDRRDAVCMQCHFEGKVAIQQPSHSLAKFEPGDNLPDFVRYYLVSGGSSKSFGALSQTEALAQSVCKRKSGDRMACISCHDAHYSPRPEEKLVYYRAKCIACHGEKFAAKHHRKDPDCRSCHMPAATTSDIAHTEATDHRILRDPKIQAPAAAQANTESRLVPFPREAGEGNSRTVALAWQALVESGMTREEGEAEHWLQKAAQDTPNDPDILSALGFAEQKHGHTDRARELYQHALQIDPLANEAATNLGIMEAQAGNVPRAISLLQGPFERIPGRSEVGINLSILYCASSQIQKARETVTRVLEFNPDLLPAKNLQRQLNSASPTCSAR